MFFEPDPNVNKSVSVSEFHNFSPTLQNELRVSYSRNNANITAGNFKFPGLDVFPNLAFDELNLQMGPDPNTPRGSIENLSTLQDNVTKTWGRHTFKAGYAAPTSSWPGTSFSASAAITTTPPSRSILLDQEPTAAT